MWSDRYNYYCIQFDKCFSQKLDKAFVIECLLATNLFKQTGQQTFTNIDKSTWINIVLSDTDDGNYSSSNSENQFVTLIAIICSKGQNIDQQIYIETFLQITSKLKWKLYLEEDDNGNEYIEITTNTK